MRLLSIILLMYLLPDGRTANQADVQTEPWDTTCPHMCSCSRGRPSEYVDSVLRTLDCSNLELHRFPDNVSLTTEAAILDRNRWNMNDIRWIERLVNLTVLDLSANHLYSLENWGLTLNRLSYLALDRNELEYLHNCTFAGVRNLRVLSLSYNNLELMHTDAFCGLQRLTRLDMSHNRIFEVTPLWFRQTSSLLYLDLRENNIHNLRRGDFTYLSSLQTLYLNSNHLKHLQQGAFTGIEGLKQLYLQDNPLGIVPSHPLRQFHSLDLLDLSNTHVSLLNNACLRDVNVTLLRLRRIPELRLVERGAIWRVPLLRTLELADNPSLAYLDRDSILDAPRLESIHLYNNSLSNLDTGLVSSLPSLRELHLYGNPLNCDCGLRWLHQDLVNHRLNFTLLRPEDTQCRDPAQFKGTSIAHSDLDQLPTTCAPRIISLFEPIVNVALGDSVRIDCRAVGEPQPQIDWRVPATQQDVRQTDVYTVNGDVIDRVVLTMQGTLIIDYIKGNDNGQYACIAVNDKGRDEQPVNLHIKNLAANVLILRVTQASITVTWKSTQSSHTYELLWRPAGGNASYHIVPIKPYMRTYTANQLTSSSLYEFCLAVMHQDAPVRINCTVVATQGAEFGRMGIISTRDYIVGGAIGCLAVVVVLGCVVTWVARKYNRRRRLQEELYGDNLSQLFLASLDSMSDTTPITYENRAAEIFDDDDIEEIRNAAAAASATTAGK